MYELDREQKQHNHYIKAPTSRRNESKLRQDIYPRLHLRELAGNQAVQHLLGSHSEQERYSAQQTATNLGGMARGGGDSPIPIRSLTEEDRLVDLQADRFKDDERLQAAFDNKLPLHLFETGPAVKKLQRALVDLGFDMPKSSDASGEPDGVFGHETFVTVKRFQWTQGIVKDGVVGRQTMGELDGLFSGQSPPGTRTPGPDQPGMAISVSTVDRNSKRFGKCGGFTWSVDWATNARNGYLVQEITRETEITSCSGFPLPYDVGTHHYWEAWRVQEDGGIHGTRGADDDWFIESLDLSDRLAGIPGTSGKWTITGRVFFCNQLDLSAGFQFKVPQAGSLWSTTEEPKNLGAELLVRSEGDSWNCCVGEPALVPEAEEDKSSETPGET